MTGTGAVRLALWLLVFPLTGAVLSFAFGTHHHAASEPTPAPWSCASVVAQYAPLGGAHGIAPLCGQTP